MSTIVPSAVVPVALPAIAGPVAPAPYYPLSVEQYHRMIESGIFHENDHVELLEGYLAMMSPIGPTHRAVVQSLMYSLIRMAPPGWHVGVQQPISLSNSEPELDVAVIRGEIRDYLQRHPGPADVAIVIEVADSSLTLDRGAKARIYAAAGVKEYWIVNLMDRQVELYREPAIGADGTARYNPPIIAPVGGQIPVALDGQVVGQLAVASILP